jgi:hypothetical protein
VTLTDLGGGRARFVPPSSGLYRFQVEVDDGQLFGRASVEVPVDDLRPDGRVGVTPRIGGLEGSAQTLTLQGTSGPTGGSIVLDASGSVDRRTDHGMPSGGMTFFWSQTWGPALLSFKPESPTLSTTVPGSATGDFGFSLVVDNGQDAARQNVRVVMQTAAGGVQGIGGGGCRAG